MAEEFLDHPQVCPVCQQVRGKTVPQHVRSHMPFNPGPQHRLGNALPECDRGEGGSPVGEKHHTRTFRPNHGMPDR